jgi:4-diphosphocytidyl-2-C-methyl-D-erythritol kinase
VTSVERAVLSGTSMSKINLFLSIDGLLPDGRHELTTWFQAIDYGDEISVEPWNGLELVCDPSDLCPMEENLAWRAADLLRRTAGVDEGARIHLRKLVPHGAGLGGGSGDAALVLRLCNRLWGLDWTFERIEELARTLGADVPFLVRGGGAWAKGAGDLLGQAANLDPNVHILVATPPVGVNTGWAYRAWDELHPPGSAWDGASSLKESSGGANLPDLHSRVTFLPEDLRGRLANSFEEVVLPRFPEIAQIRHEMGRAGAAASLLSGSGSSVFGLFEGRTAPGTILREWERRNIRWRWCRPAKGAPRE